MTMLAALWNQEGRPAARACAAMLRAQIGRESGRAAVGDHGGMALARGACHASPEAEAGAGPVAGAGGALTLIADARIDNRGELLARLGKTASGDVACSDARLMMLSFEAWGAEAVERFVGDFALALWDARSERLLLARDFAGQRPLVFCRTGQALAVASSACGLHALDFVPRGADEGRLLEVLAGLPHEGRTTFFRGIERVEPGEVVEFGRGATAARIFWSPPAGEIRLGSHAEYAEALTEKIDQAVAARLRGAGEAVAAQLSAGLDSSAVVASAARGWSGRVHAFTSVPAASPPPVPAGRFADEGDLAAETAALYPNVEHHRIPTADRIPIAQLPAELALYERSDLNLPNLVWANRINDAAAAAGLRVMLTGQAGNATISYGGLEVLQDFLAERRFGSFLIEAAAARRSGVAAGTLLAIPARHFLPRRVLGALTRLRRRDQHPGLAGAINPEAARVSGILARYEANAARSFAGSRQARLHMLRRVDPGSFNKGVLTRWNIDLRDPTVDRRVVEYCLQVPLSHYFRGGTQRALIRTAIEGRVPESVRCSRLRGLQAAGWYSLLAGARGEMQLMLADIRQSEAARALLDLDGMERVLGAMPSDPRGYGSLAYRYGLLRGLSAGQFLRLFAD